MRTEKPIKIAVVDDQQLFRQGLLSLIKEFSEFEVVMEATNGKECIEMARKNKPEVILLDVEMPVMDGAEVTEYLHKKHPEIKIIILTMHDDDELVFHLAKKGAHGFLLKDSSIETVADAVFTVMAGKRYFKENIMDMLLEGLHKTQNTLPGLNDKMLSDREKEVLKLICKQHTTREISEMLAISHKTVEGHRDKIFSKTKVRNIAGLVMYAVKNNLLD